jgi:EpsI family protein
VLDRLKSIQMEYWAIVPVCFVFVAIILIYNTTAMLIFEEWQVGEYSHGMLAIPIALYLFSLDRDKLQIVRSFHWLPLLGLIAATIAWICAKAANVFLIEILSLFGIFVSAVGLLHGPLIWRYCFSALLSVFLVMPIWGVLKTPLQVISADMTELILRFIGLAVYREDFTFVVPGGAFLIEPACSGLGFFLSSCLLSVIYSKVFKLTATKTIVLFLAAISISIFSNWVRIIIIMVVGNATQMQHPIVSDHLTFGWMLFSLMLVPFILIANQLISKTAEVNATDTSSPAAPTWTKHSSTKFVQVAILLIAGPAALFTLDNRSTSASTFAMEATLEETLPAFKGRRTSISWDPTFIGATDITLRRAAYNQRELMLLTVHYRSQNQGQELIYFANSLFDKHRWKLISKITDGTFTTILLRDKRGQERLITYSYYFNGQFTSNERWAKLLELMGFLQGNRDAYLIGIAVDNPSPDDPELINDIRTILTKNV